MWPLIIKTVKKPEQKFLQRIFFVKKICRAVFFLQAFPFTFDPLNELGEKVIRAH